MSNTFSLHCLSCPGSPLLTLGSKLGPVVAPSWRKQNTPLWMSPVCPQAEFVLPGAHWLLLPSFPCVCYGTITTQEGNNGNETRIKGESGPLQWGGSHSHVVMKERSLSPSCWRWGQWHTHFSKVPCKGRRLDLSPASHSCTRHWTAALSFSDLKSAG